MIEKAITRSGHDVGRVRVDGIQMHVEYRHPVSGDYIPLGRYEDLEQPDNLGRKWREIDSVFDAWLRYAQTVPGPHLIKLNWVKGIETPAAYRKPESDNSGAIEICYAGKVVGNVYKYKDDSGVWVLQSPEALREKA